jgi:hypothetical protein
MGAKLAKSKVVLSVRIRSESSASGFTKQTACISPAVFLQGFDYAGHAKEDLPVVVNARLGAEGAPQEHGNVTMVLPKAKKVIHALRALR